VAYLCLLVDEIGILKTNSREGE